MLLEHQIGHFQKNPYFLMNSETNAFYILQALNECTVGEPFWIKKSAKNIGNITFNLIFQGSVSSCYIFDPHLVSKWLIFFAYFLVQNDLLQLCDVMLFFCHVWILWHFQQAADLLSCDETAQIKNDQNDS